MFNTDFRPTVTWQYPRKVYAALKTSSPLRQHDMYIIERVSKRH